MRNNNQTKQRTDRIRSLCAHQDGSGECVLSVSINTVDGTSSASDNGVVKQGHATVERAYMGERKWKVDAALPFDHKDAIDANIAIDRYDIVCAVDTNSKNIRGQYVDIGSAFRLVSKVGEKGDTTFEGLLMEEFVDCNSYQTEDFEKRNWVKCIHLIQKKYPDAKKVLIVVDSDYRNIEDYNCRNKMILETLLPEGFVFIHATANSGNEWMNKLLKMSDGYNREKFKSLMNIGN